MKKSDLSSVLSDTLLKPVIEWLQSGEFREPTEAMAAGEEVIGEMTTFEKALSSALDLAVSEHNVLVDAKRVGAFVEESTLQLTHTRSEALKDLMWSTIMIRIGAETFKGGGIGIRQGFKIVRMPERVARMGLRIDPLALMLAGMGAGAGGIRRGAGVGHDCGKCDGYDECDAPYKTHRA